MTCGGRSGSSLSPHVKTSVFHNRSITSIYILIIKKHRQILDKFYWKLDVTIAHV
jgi:hypothetical protein